MLGRDFANTTANIGLGAMQKAAFKQQPNLGVLLAQGVQAYNDAKAQEERNAQLGAYSEALKEAHPEDAARIDAMGALEAGKYYDALNAEEREQQNKLAYLAQQHQNAIGLEALRNRNAYGLAEFKNNIANAAANAERERQAAAIEEALQNGYITPEQANMARVKMSLGDIAKGMYDDKTGGSSFGTTPAGLALAISQNPDQFNENAKTWSNNFLNSANPDYVYGNAFQKAAGKAQGEYGGAQAIDEQKGYVFENGQKYPVAGTVAEDEYLSQYGKNIAANNETQRVAKTVLEDIDAIERLIKEHPLQAAGWGSTMSFIPGTAARDIKARIESIKGNSGVDSLLMIKKSGAGLGQIPQRQMDMLSSMMGNLDQAQTLPELKDVIARYKRIYENVYNNATSDNEKIYSRIKPQNTVGQTQNDGSETVYDAASFF